MEIAALPLSGIQPEFELEIGPHGAGELAVLEMEISEELSKPYSAEITVIAREGVEVDPGSILGEEATLLVHLGLGDVRYLHGIVASFDHWDAGAGPDRHRYRARIAPRLWKLEHRVQSRIFQNMTVPEIVTKVLDEGRVELRSTLSSRSGFETHPYTKRDTCIQYRESDLDFVSRLLAEEGIFYWFEHEQGKHTMVLADSAPSCPSLPGDPQIVFREQSGMVTEEHVDSFLSHLEVRPTAVTLRDFNYLKPGLDLTATANGGGEELEIYDYPGRYVVNVGGEDEAVSDEAEGKARARTRLEEARVGAETASGSSTSRRLAPGYIFELVEHPGVGFDGEYLILSVKHHGWQPEALTHGLREGRGTERRRYRNEMTCLRKGIPFRPERPRRPIIAGPQTATVTGPANEEIHTDGHGRVKVQFHWDREGKRDDRSSSWIRVSQAWAGAGYGAFYLPRVGHEVVVEFSEGDPDRSLITGSVYNGQNPPPLTLPSEKTRSTLRSASSPGGVGSNELRFEDLAGKEEIYLHAEKDMSIVVENDKAQRVGGNETLKVDKDRDRTVCGNQTLLVELDDTSAIHGNQSLDVGMNRSVFVGGKHTETVLGDQSVAIRGSSQLTVILAEEETVGLGKRLDIGAAYDVQVGAGMRETVNGQKSEEVAGDKWETIRGDKKETVFGSRELDVTGSLTERIDQSRTLKVGTDLVVNAKNVQQAATLKYTLEASEVTVTAKARFALQVGSASIEAAQGGDMVINGSAVQVVASGILMLKGASISGNG